METLIHNSGMQECRKRVGSPQSAVIKNSPTQKLISYFLSFVIRHSSLVIFLTLLFSLSASAQTNIKAVQDAFETSYAQEKKGELNKAMSTMTAVYAEDSYEINARLGWLNYVAGLFTESMAYYQKAIKLRPYAIEARFGYVNPAYALGNLDQVITQYQEILKIDPQNTTVNYRMASILYGKNDFATAERYAEKVVNLYPFDYDSHLLYGWILLKMNKTREAQVMFNKVLILKPKDVSATQGLSQIK
jgi:tetratricopeptide (TPR) repeat protein